MHVTKYSAPPRDRLSTLKVRTLLRNGSGGGVGGQVKFYLYDKWGLVGGGEGDFEN